MNFEVNGIYQLLFYAGNNTTKVENINIREKTAALLESSMKVSLEVNTE